MRSARLSDALSIRRRRHAQYFRLKHNIKRLFIVYCV